MNDIVIPTYSCYMSAAVSSYMYIYVPEEKKSYSMSLPIQCLLSQHRNKPQWRSSTHGVRPVHLTAILAYW